MKTLSAILVFALFLPQLVFSQTWTSEENGPYNQISTWDRSDVPGCNINNSRRIIIRHQIASDCNPLNLSGSTLRLLIEPGGDFVINGNLIQFGSGGINIEGKLTINGILNHSGSGRLTISNTGVLIVNGNFLKSGTGAILIEEGGRLIVNGNILNSGGGTFDNSGEVEVYGDFSKTGSGDLINRDGSILNVYSTNDNDGNLIVDGSVKLVIDGTANIDRDLRTSGSGGVTIGGELTVFGDLVKDPGSGNITVNNLMQVDGDGSYRGSGRLVVNGLATFGGIGCINWTGPGICLDNTPLPVELLSFDAELLDKTIHLSWSTAAELNNDYFTLERSADGINFDVIGTIPGAGTTNETSHYEHTDSNPLLGMAYYRLSQTDFDGTHEILGIRAVNFIPSDAAFSIYPNPLRPCSHA